MNKKLCIFSIAAALTSNVHAASIVFDLRDTGATNAIEAGSYTIDGVTMSLSSPQGALNQTTSSFGINHAIGFSDESAQIDGDEGAETLIFSFDIVGTLDQLSFSLFGENDKFTLKKGTTTIFSIDDQDSPAAFIVGESFTPSDVFYLTFTEGEVDGGGASLNAVQITAVPEPSSFLLLGFGGLTLLSRRKRPASSNLRNVRFHRPSNHNS